MNATEKLQLKELVNREAIRDVVMRYCHGADRCDEKTLLGVYWPDATDNHGVFTGSAQDYIPYLLKRAGAMDQMQHLVGNILIRISGNSATCESYFFGYHRHKDDRGVPQDNVVGGRYLDELECRDEEWRILRRNVVFDWFRDLAGSVDWSAGIGGTPVTMGSRVPADPSGKLFANTLPTLPFGQSGG
jgi:hypothetical protein